MATNRMKVRQQLPRKRVSDTIVQRGSWKVIPGGMQEGTKTPDIVPIPPKAKYPKGKN